MKTIVDAPFVSYAVPVKHGAIPTAYWQSDAAVSSLAFRFSQKSGKAIAKLAGEARLSGIVCRHCNQEIVVKNRGQAISVLQQFESCLRYGRNKIECTPCGRADRDRRAIERMRMFRAPPAVDQRAVATKVIEAKNAGNRCSKPSPTAKNEFYASWEWRTLRMEILKEHGRACQCCGAEPGMKTAAGDPVRICVDHIKPLSKFWHLRLTKTNLQVLCDECNQGKGNWDQTDFRPVSAPDEWVIEDDGISDDIRAQLTNPMTGTLQ